MSVASEAYRTQNWSSQRSASLPRRPGLRKRHHYVDPLPYRNVFPAVDTLSSSLQSYTLSTRESIPKPSTIDPELRDAQKLGSRYHITMNVSALLDPPVNAASEIAVTPADYTTLRSSSSSVNGFALARKPATTINGGGGGRMSVIRMGRDDDQEINGHHKVQPLTARRSGMTDDGYVIQSIRASSSSVSRPESVQHQDESFAIRSVTPSAKVGAAPEPKEEDKVTFDLQLIGLDAYSSRKPMQQTSYIVKAETQNSQRTLHKNTEQPQTLSDVEPMYTMTIDETMTMDYYQPEESTRLADRDSVAKQAKSNMPRPPPSRPKGPTYDEEKTRRVAHQQLASAPVGSPKAAPRATHRKRPKPAKDTDEPDATVRRAGPPSSGAYRSMTIGNSLNGEQWKRIRNVRDKSDEGFVVVQETRKAQNSQRPRHDLVGQRLKAASSPRPKAAANEPDGATAPYRDHSSSSRTLVQYETLIPTERGETTGKIGGSDEGIYTRRGGATGGIEEGSNEGFYTGRGGATGRIEGGSDEGFYTGRGGATGGIEEGSNEGFYTGRGGATGKIEGGSDEGFHTEIQISQRLRDQPRLVSSTVSSNYARRLMKDAPEGSVRHRMDIERQEEEVAGPLEDKATAYSSSDQTSTHNLLNVDLVSEQVDMTMENGVAQLVVKVTCERLVPIHGSADQYKKSSITVSRFIDVDLKVTEERRRIYDQVMKNCLPSGKLSNRDTFELYMAFMELAELHPSAEWDQQQLRIDKKVDEERLAKYTSLENQLGGNDGSTRYGVKSNTLASKKVRLVRSPNSGFAQKSTNYGAHEFSSLSAEPDSCGPLMYLERSFNKRPVAGERSATRHESNCSTAIN